MVAMKIRSSPVDATAHSGPTSEAIPPIEE